MTVFFSKSIGRVVRLIDPSVPCQTHFFGMGGDKITFTEQRSIVTRLVCSQAVNVQFLHTLGSSVYIYVFGDRVGQITLSGLGFQNPCVGQSADSCDSMTGLEGMYKWYRKNRVAARKRPILVTLGSESLEGFVLDFNADVIDVANGLSQWQMQLATLPEN